MDRETELLYVKTFDFIELNNDGYALLRISIFKLKLSLLLKQSLMTYLCAVFME